MSYSKSQTAYSLIGMLISSLLAVCVVGLAMHYFVLVANYYVKIQRGFDYMNAKLVARHYLLSDMRKANSISFFDQKLLLQSNHTVIYELRDSIIPKHEHMHAYALYRDDGQTRSEAIVEGITDWRVQVGKYATTVTIKFKDNSLLEIKV